MDNGLLNLPEAKWNVSGLFAHDDLLLYIYDLFMDMGVKLFHSVHGSTPCRWNSGRAIRRHSQDYVQQCMSEYRKRKLPIYLTFSNYLIDKDMLADEEGNQLLDMISEDAENGIILSSPLLSKHVKERYPRLKQYSSILNVVNCNGKGDIRFYLRAEHEFDMVVLHPDDCFDIDFLKKIENKGKYEVIVNENCIRNCPYRKEHENMVCNFFRENRSSESFQKMYDFTQKNCKSLYSNKLANFYAFGKYQNCNLTRQELEQIYSLGYRSFKLQGRNDSPATFAYDIFRYLVKGPVMDILFRLVMNQISETPFKKELAIYFVKDNENY